MSVPLRPCGKPKASKAKLPGLACGASQASVGVTVQSSLALDTYAGLIGMYDGRCLYGLANGGHGGLQGTWQILLP
jgi:hypothetical protein